MERKYTHGPWFPVDYAGSICIQSGPMYDDLDLLCYDSIFSDITPPSKETVEANAKLMATAPEMLECLNELTNCIQGITNGRVILTIPIELSQKIGETIRKATQ